jgi:hypothetical protein
MSRVNPDIIDTSWIKSVLMYIAKVDKDQSPAWISYSRLAGILSKSRAEHSGSNGTLGGSPIALGMLWNKDPNQVKFFQELREGCGMDVETIQLFHCAPSAPAGGRLSKDKRTNLGSMVIYHCMKNLSLMEKSPGSVMHIVSGSFDFAYPLRSIASTSRTKIILAGFRELIDFRWWQLGLGSEQFPIQFLDLTKYSEDLFSHNPRVQHILQNTATKRNNSKG